ncbi:hypothetical protein IC757_01780 [Wenzhouxiangella sp. AB-CW3]|uniref:hypothetical protein n=1 Tax=Wenzhouxiangella sp. AB-CW3 TaxID=2771012 RepID=UPI00168B51D5|nr:hypothetical protein [Wenzhouxiangella sp. AB-CW3]QOC22917.1 hypothetical protein IC757_01780 [Wenzhouxiangella sp. AB-CW3]
MNSSRLYWILLTWILAVLASPAHTLSPPPPQPDDELLPMLYSLLDGDNWHRNDG